MVGILALCVVIAVTAAWVSQRAFIYPAPPVVTIMPPQGYEEVMLQSSDGLTLRAFYKPAVAARPTLLFFHGNGDNLRGSIVVVGAAVAAGYGALLPEYRGYGGNSGTPDEAGFYADGRAARQFLANAGVAPESTILVGNSLGSGVATQLAFEAPLAALVIISGYTSLPDVIVQKAGGFPIGWLVRDKFENLAKIGKVAAPVLVMHGENDRVIPFAHGKALAAAGKGVSFEAFAAAGHELAYTDAAGAAMVAWLANIHRHTAAETVKALP